MHSSDLSACLYLYWVYYNVPHRYIYLVYYNVLYRYIFGVKSFTTIILYNVTVTLLCWSIRIPGPVVLTSTNIHCRIRSDHNMDGTPFIMGNWCAVVKRLYLSVDCYTSHVWLYPTRNPSSKPVQRYKNVARLRQQALEAAREAGADYLFVSPSYRLSKCVDYICFSELVLSCDMFCGV